ncbi:hypothetical protein HZ99_14055 [Pseudomonas fluorescens]|nr:hypothetical protein HZ99_14055 [Pseudomonas fluorescens]
MRAEGIIMEPGSNITYYSPANCNVFKITTQWELDCISADSDDASHELERISARIGAVGG